MKKAGIYDLFNIRDCPVHRQLVDLMRLYLSVSLLGQAKAVKMSSRLRAAGARSLNSVTDPGT